MELSRFLETYKDPHYAYEKIILIRNARHVLEGEMNRKNLAQLQQSILHLKKFLPGKAALIYCDERRFIPDELSSLVYFLDIKPPPQEELAEIAEEFIGRKGLEGISPDLVYQLSATCVGMSKDSFAQILGKALGKGNGFAQAVLPMAEKTKKQFVDKSGLLKFVNTEVDMDNDVGGLDHLQWWLKQKKKAFENPKDAEARGIKPAKGILLVGMPGCGKSLASKAVANFFGLPLLSLDLGTLMGKYLGESEENLRRALRLAENSSPCVLWVDEVEKAFAGVGGDESGVSQRLFGYLLTWLNDKKEKVFVMATANDIAVLPPEFLRRGRFDEIFYVDFPNEQERKEIFKIYLRKALGENGKEKLEEILAKGDNKKKFEDLTRNRKPEEAGSDTDTVVSDLKRALRDRELLKGELEKSFTKDEIGKILADEYSARKIEEFIRLKKAESKDGGAKGKKPADGAKEYPGTEGYAGSDIQALVNSAVERAWAKDKDIETDIFDILQQQRKYMTPLKEVLAEKIARNREKFGQYKLASASETADNLIRFESDSEGTDGEKEEVAGDERCPTEILIKLAKKGSAKVKLAVLENPSCPPSCVTELWTTAIRT